MVTRPLATSDSSDAPLARLSPAAQRRLAASRAVVELFLRERTTAFSVAELAHHAGISERTFYRYFPRKEDAVKPFFDAGLAELVERVRAQPVKMPLQEAFARSFHEAFAASGMVDWAAITTVLSDTESLRATTLQVMTDGENRVAELVASRFGIAPTSARARLCGAVIIAAARLAIDGARYDDRPSPADAFAEHLGLLGPSLFAAGAD